MQTVYNVIRMTIFLCRDKFAMTILNYLRDNYEIFTVGITVRSNFHFNINKKIYGSISTVIL